MREPTEFEESEYLAELEGERGRRRPVRRVGQRPGARPGVRFARPATRRQLLQSPQLRPGVFRSGPQRRPGMFRSGFQGRPGMFRPGSPFRRPGRQFPFPRRRRFPGRFPYPGGWPIFPPGFQPEPSGDSQDQGSRSSSFGSGSSSSPFPGGPAPQGSEHIRWVQSSLNRILNLNLPVNGIMDDQTRSAVRDFQNKKGLPADGIVGPPTERAIVEASSAPPSTPPAQGGNGQAPPPATTAPEPEPAATGQEELFEFFPELEFADNEMSLESEFENWHNELHEGESNGCGCHGKSEVLPELETSFELEEENGRPGQIPLTLGVAGDPKIIDLTAKGDKSQRLRIRPPEKVWALVLHQMACCFKVKDPLTRFLKMAPHFAILPDGRILQIHPLQAYTPASNGFNAGSVAVEFAGNFPSTRGKWWISKSLKTDAQRKANQNQVTPEQIESGRYLVQYLKRTMGLKTILAHRQSSGTRENDPGPDIWYNVGQWAVDNLGLSDGGPGFKVGTGNPIPDLWRKWGEAKPQPEVEIGAYETEQWETPPSTGTTTFKYVKDLSGPAAECTEALRRAGKTKEEALKLINNQIAVAIAMLRKSATRLKRGSRSSTTSAIFQKIFRVKPGYVPTWLKQTATIKDRGDVVATRCRRVADLLASGRIKFFCTINSTNCPDCANDAAPFACSSWGDESVAPRSSNVVCLGHGFWDDMKAGNTNSMISTIMHEPFHIYYGKYVTAHALDRGKFGGINCIVQFVFETNSRTVPGRVKDRCRAMPVRA